VFEERSNDGENPLVPGSLFSRLFMPDDYHPSLLGTYLAACVFFAVITGRSPEGNAYLPGEADANTTHQVPLTPAEAAHMQTVAWVVASDAAAGDKEPAAPSFLQVDPARYEELLRDRLGAATALLQASRLLPDGVACEVHRSRPTHYRQRVGFGIYDRARAGEYRLALPEDPAGHELSYVYWDSGEMVPIDRHECLLASEAINAAMPHLLRFVTGSPELRSSLRSVKFLTNMRGDDLVCSLIYGGGAADGQSQPGPDPPASMAVGGSAWMAQASLLRTALKEGSPALLGDCHISILGRARGVLATLGVPYVMEDGFRQDGAPPFPPPLPLSFPVPSPLWP